MQSTHIGVSDGEWVTVWWNGSFFSHSPEQINTPWLTKRVLYKTISNWVLTMITPYNTSCTTLHYRNK